MKLLVLFVFVWATVINGALAAGRGMVPYLDYSVFRPTDKTLSITDVATPTKEDEEYDIDKDAFEKAMIETLKKSGLFRRISKDAAGDYELQYELKTAQVGDSSAFIGPAIGNLDTVILFVRYVFVETKTKRIIWKQNVLSQRTSKGSKIDYAKDAAARENLTRLVEGVSETLTAESKTPFPSK